MSREIRYRVRVGLAVTVFILVSVISSFAETINYIYDDMNRLMRIEYSNGKSTQYGYDNVGNRSMNLTRIELPSVIGSHDTTYDYDNVIADGNTVTIYGYHTFNNLRIANGGKIIAASLSPLQMSVIGTLTIDSGCSIDVSGKGYGGGYTLGNTITRNSTRCQVLTCDIRFGNISPNCI